MELKLPDINSPSPEQIKSQRVRLSRSAPNSTLVTPGKATEKGSARCMLRRANSERQVFGAASSTVNLALPGNNFEYTKMLTKESHKSSGTWKYYGNCLERSEKGIFPVYSGPWFTPWSRGKKETRKHIDTEGDYSVQEANVHRFYYKQQRPTSDCFNLGRILSEVSGISRVSENHVRQELNRMKASYKILCPGPIQGEGIEQDCLLEESEKECTVPPKVTPVRKEQHFKNLLRRKMMSCYDLGPAMKPFDAIEGESLSSLKNYRSRDFSQY